MGYVKAGTATVTLQVYDRDGALLQTYHYTE
jgi:hypothetical protein